MITIPNLDCDVTSRCNASCCHCNRMVNPYRFAPGGPPSTTPQQVEHDLYHFGLIARTKRWAALGGEPTLHKQLVDILRVVRASGVCEDIAVWTNGIILRRMSDEFWRAFDTLVVSVYPGKVSDEDVQWIRDKCVGEGVRLELKDERVAPNWTRILEAEPTDAATTYTKYHQCWFRTYCRALNFGYLFQCCTSPHIPQLLQGREYGADGVKIEGLMEQGMRDFLFRDEPLGACTVCMGRNTPRDVFVPWEEAKDKDEWLRVSRGQSA